MATNNEAAADLSAEVGRAALSLALAPCTSKNESLGARPTRAISRSLRVSLYATERGTRCLGWIVFDMRATGGRVATETAQQVPSRAHRSVLCLTREEKCASYPSGFCFVPSPHIMRPANRHLGRSCHVYMTGLDTRSLSSLQTQEQPIRTITLQFLTLAIDFLIKSHAQCQQIHYGVYHSSPCSCG